MPRRPVPRQYDTPPLFYPEGADVIDWHGEGPPRDELGRFVFTQPKIQEPTRTMAPTDEEKRPRTLAATYDPADRTLRIMFRNGKVYGYYDVPPTIWRSLRTTPSTGRFINRRLDPFFEYGPEQPADL